MKLLPCFFHPTTIILVDDDVDLLRTFKLNLLNEGVKSACFSSAKKAKEFILNEKQKAKLTKPSFLRRSYSDSSDLSINVQIKAIMEQIYNKERFKELVILVIDYDMPEMNGLELARLIRENEINLKVIMLTGAADQETAINAFNNKEIDKFLLKSLPNTDEKLVKYMNELQFARFVEESQSIMESLKIEQENPFNNDEFISFFNALCAENNIVEYYLLDESGSYFLYDQKGNNPIWLITRTEKEMDELYNMVIGERKISNNILEKIKNRELILYFETDKEELALPEEWKFREAKQLNKTGIYYSILREVDVHQLNKTKILTYEDYLNSDND